MAKRTYEQRTRMNTQGARLLAKAFVERPQFIADDAGNMVRQWRAEELQTFKNADIAAVLSGFRALETHELLEGIPPTAIKYAVTKGWLVMDRVAGFYWVTDKAAFDLKLPRKVGGLTIKFLKMAA